MFLRFSMFLRFFYFFEVFEVPKVFKAFEIPCMGWPVYIYIPIRPSCK